MALTKDSIQYEIELLTIQEKQLQMEIMEIKAELQKRLNSKFSFHFYFIKTSSNLDLIFE